MKTIFAVVVLAGVAGIGALLSVPKRHHVPLANTLRSLRVSLPSARPPVALGIVIDPTQHDMLKSGLGSKPEEVIDISKLGRSAMVGVYRVGPVAAGEVLYEGPLTGHVAAAQTAVRKATQRPERPGSEVTGNIRLALSMLSAHPEKRRVLLILSDMTADRPKGRALLPGTFDAVEELGPEIARTGVEVYVYDVPPHRLPAIRRAWAATGSRLHLFPLGHPYNPADLGL